MNLIDESLIESPCSNRRNQRKRKFIDDLFAEVFQRIGELYNKSEFYLLLGMSWKDGVAESFLSLILLVKNLSRGPAIYDQKSKSCI